MKESFRDLRFSTLQLLELDYDNVRDDYPHYHFYTGWDFPALETLRLRNIIPRLRSGALDGVINCTLSFGKRRIFIPNLNSWRWQIKIDHVEIDQIMTFLNTLAAVRVLDVTLYGGSRYDHNYGFRSMPQVYVSLPSVRHLSTIAIGLGREASRFWCAIRKQNMSTWTIGFDVPSEGASCSTIDRPLNQCLQDIFPGSMSYPNLKELNFIIHRGFGRSDNAVLASVLTKGSRMRVGSQHMFHFLEHLSVTYPDGEQGFFGQTDRGHSRCTTQLRSIHLNDCKGMFRDVMRRLEDRFIGETGDGNARLVVDGAKVREAERRSGDSGSDGGVSWASLVLDAKIVRE